MQTQKLFLVVSILAMAVSARAVIYLSPIGGDYDNFQAAVDAAIAAGGTQTIIVADGKYQGDGNYDIAIAADGLNLTIESENGPDRCIVNAQRLGRVFGLRNVNGDDSVVIRGLTIVNGIAPDEYGGGGIYNHNSILTVENCRITDNNSTKGGGIYTGGMAGSLVLKDSVIADNISVADYSGAGMHVVNNISVNVIGCVFKNNSVPGPYIHAGGGVFISQCDVDFKNCIFEGNSVDNGGGVVYAINCTIDFTNCTFTGNLSGWNGGVGYIIPGQYPTTVDVKNCIFTNNKAGNRGNTFFVGSHPIAGATLNYSYSNIDDSLQSIDGYGVWNDLGGNINVDPLFARNGYRDDDVWVSGDYHLRSMVGRWDPALKDWVVDDQHSPCIDAGDPADCVGDEPDGFHGDRINMGAYGGTAQASKSPYCPGTLIADLNNDCRVDLLDFAIFASEWLMCDLIPQSLCWD